MKKTALDVWLRRPGNTQSALAERLGVAQSTISRMRMRKVKVVQQGETLWLEETRVRAGSNE